MTDVFHKAYNELTEEQKAVMAEIKDKAEILYSAIESQVQETERSEKSRCVALAKTKLEEAVMWAIKGVTA